MTKFQTVMPRVMVTEITRTANFYCESLGFTVDVLWPEKSPVFCILSRNHVRLGFYIADEHRPNARIGSAEFHIDVQGVTELHDQLKPKMSVEWGPEVFFYGRREFAVKDPDGYLVIFSEQTTDPPTCPDQA